MVVRKLIVPGRVVCVDASHLTGTASADTCVRPINANTPKVPCQTSSRALASSSRIVELLLVARSLLSAEICN
jgi:hypothetical protein